MPSWLSGLLRPFSYSSSVYFCHLFLISSAFVRSLPFLSFITPILAYIPLVSPISLKRSLVFPTLLFPISLHCSYKKTILSLLALLWNSAFSWVYLSLSPWPFTSLVFSLQFNRSVVSDSLQPHELQHARPPCPSPTPGVHSDSHPSSQ